MSLIQDVVQHHRRVVSNAALAGALAAAITAPSAHAVQVNFVVEQLPAGLIVGIAGSRTACTNGLMTPESAGSVALTEQDTVVYTVVTGPNGPILRPQVVTTYVGHGDFSSVASSGHVCSGVAPSLTFDASVLGQSSVGAPALRIASAIAAGVNPSAPITVDKKLQGSTTGLPAAIDMSRGSTIDLTVSHNDPFGNSFIVSPVLQFQRSGLTSSGLFVTTTVRLFIDANGNKCIGTDALTSCSNNTPLVNGRLVSNGVEMLVSNTQHHGFSTTFVFQLDQSFASGTWNLSAFADDRDPFRYMVDRVPTSLNLLTWLPSISTATVH